MDRQMVALFIPIVALMIPIVAVMASAWQKTAKLRLDEARARAGLLDGVDAAEVEALRGEVVELRGELEQVHDRLDFTERLLVQVRDRQALPGDGAG